ncbi:MAG: AlkZ family DNA glycosylase [Phycisphaerae bacterium]|nr:AlkZ family DNA glycosylase [Saprospiraceae bacterium]
MLTPATIAHLRLQNQQIARSKFSTPQEIVAWHGAKQAQEYTHAKWAVGLRLPDATDQTIEQAIDAGSIVRTHILRPTWHFVAAPDVRWMMRLTAPQIVMQSIARERDLGLDLATFHRTNEVIAKTLEGGRQRTRKELAEAIEQAGIMTNSYRMAHIMFRAETELLVCNGSRRGKEQTYALLDERIPPSRMLEREEALAELARRYFTSHAPATIQDFTWWSGLKVGDARAALEMIKSDFISVPLDHLTYWMPKDLDLPAELEPSVHLLPAFDEFMVSYKERGASLDPSQTTQAITGNGIFKPIVVVNGRVVGVWSRTEKKNTMVIEHQFFKDVSPAEREGIENAAARFGKFLGREIVIK